VQPKNRFRCGGTAGWRRSPFVHSAYGQPAVANLDAALARVVVVAASARARSCLCRPGAPPVYRTSAGMLFRACNQSSSLDAHRESHIFHFTGDPLRRVRPGPPTSAPPSLLRQARSAHPPGCPSQPECYTWVKDSWDRRAMYIAVCSILPVQYATSTPSVYSPDT